MPKHEALFVRYCAKDFLDGTQSLLPLEELAYRRICDMIYDTGDRLRDDDKRMPWLTKTGKYWPKIKSVLFSASGGASGKLYIDQGFIRNDRCSKEISYVNQKRDAAAVGGRNTAKTGKSLKNLKPFQKQTQKQTQNHTTEAPTELNHLTTKPLRIPPKSPRQNQKGGLRANGTNPRAIGTNPRANAEKKPNGAMHPSDLPPSEPWQNRVQGFRKTGFWMPLWGPKPDEPGCFVPSQFLA